MFADFQRKRDRHAIALFALALLLAGIFLGGTVYAYSRWGTRAPEPEPEPEPEMEIVVEFAADEPEPEPEPIEPIVQPEPVAVFRPAAPRPVITPPDEIPDARPEEREGPLTNERTTGPVGGDLRGVPGGRGGQTTSAEVRPEPPPPPPPPPPPTRRERPRVEVESESVRPGGPRFQCVEPPEVRAQGVAGVVLVRVQVDAQGLLTRYDIVRGPELLQGVVRQCLREHWREFNAARQPDGSPIAWVWVQPFQFRARNL